MRAIAEPHALFPSQGAIRILSARFPAGSMLPLLRSLCWLYVPSERLRSSVPLLVSPHLTYIQLHFMDNSPEHCLPVVRTLTNAAGSLKSIELVPEFDTAEMQDAVSALLLSCNPNLLHNFCVASPISEAALLHAAQIPGLRRFSLRSGTPALSDPLPLTMFPSLESLLISVGDLFVWLEILRHIQSKQLKILSVDFEDSDDGSPPRDNNPLPTILTHLQHSEIHKTLTELSLCPGSQWGINRISIEPLLVLRELTSLTIYTSCQDDRCLFSLSDRDLEHLVKAMPKLETLSLGVPCAKQMHDNLTLKSLIAIARYCKALKTLRMHINCESIVMNTRDRNLPDDSFTMIPSDYEGCQLRFATFGPCPIPFDSEGALLVAMTLLHLFPQLHEVRWTALETIFPWSYVKTLIAEHSLVRLNLARFGESSKCVAEELRSPHRSKSTTYSCVNHLLRHTFSFYMYHRPSFYPYLYLVPRL